MRKPIPAKITLKARGTKDSWEAKWWLIARVIAAPMHNSYKKRAEMAGEVGPVNADHVGEGGV